MRSVVRRSVKRKRRSSGLGVRVGASGGGHGPRSTSGRGRNTLFATTSLRNRAPAAGVDRPGPCPTRTARALTILAAATTAALPATADAKGIAALTVCGANGCHPVDRAAVRAGFEAFRRAGAPRGAEPFFTIRARARVSSGEVVEVFSLDWLPRAGLTRPYAERTWTRPAPVLAAALRRAARGLAPHPAAELGSVSDGPPVARVVEVYAPAEPRATPTARPKAPTARRRSRSSPPPSWPSPP